MQCGQNSIDKPYIVETKNVDALKMLNWVNRRIYQCGLTVKNLTKDWQDGRSFCALAAALHLNFKGNNKDDGNIWHECETNFSNDQAGHSKRIMFALKKLHDDFKIPILLDEEITKFPDKLSIHTQLIEVARKVPQAAGNSKYYYKYLKYKNKYLQLNY